MRAILKTAVISICIAGTLCLGTSAYAASFTLERTDDESTLEVGSEIVLTLGMNNLENQEVASYKTWLQFNPEILEVLDVEEVTDDFALAMPGANDVDNDTGVISMGYGRTGANPSETTQLATIRFLVKDLNQNATQVSVIRGSGEETTIQGLDESGIPTSILSGTLPRVSVVFSQEDTESTVLYSTEEDTPVTETEENLKPAAPESVMKVKLPAPTGVTVESLGNDAVRLRWNAVGGAQGYYVYHTKYKGSYLHRTQVLSTTFSSENLQGETWYFFVSAMDSEGTEGIQSYEVSSEDVTNMLAFDTNPPSIEAPEVIIASESPESTYPLHGAASELPNSGAEAFLLLFLVLGSALSGFIAVQHFRK